MIMGLREKLKAMSTSCHLQPKPERAEDISQSSSDRGSLGGRVVSSQWGQHVCRITKYPLNHSYGDISFDGILNVDNAQVYKWARLEGDQENYSMCDYVFLDTETTGLSGGVGTLAFLIGLGYFEDDSFVIEQHLMRDFDEELSMLNNVASIMDKRRALVTFNGKSYDYPLLENRMIYNRISWDMNSRYRGFHIDLLHPSRRIWSSLLDSCSLASLESNILHAYRKDDIPGQDIPDIYYRYLEDRDETFMLRVMDHNLMDILAMLALFIKLANINQNPEEVGLKCHEWFGLGKSLEVQGDEAKALYCYLKCIEMGETQYITLSAKDRLAMIYKRQGRWQQAVQLWKSMADREENFRVLPLIEIAKYYEHQEKNYEKALLYTDKAMKILTHTSMTRNAGKNIHAVKEIEHRRNRLIRKRKDDTRCL